MNWKVQTKVINLPAMIKNGFRISPYCIFFFLLTLHLQARAQYFPAEGDSINYTSVLFEFPWVSGANEYELHVTQTRTGATIIVHSEANKTIVGGLEFGEAYSWKVRGINSLNENLAWSSDIHFTTRWSEWIDKNHYRYTGKKLDRNQATKGLLFFDYGRVAVNRAGIPFWFLPDLDSIGSATLVRDLKLTQQGTFTVLLGETALEVDRNGTILWQAPDDGKLNGEAREHYHHELTKLPNGNYMVLGLDKKMRRLPDSSDSIEVEFGTIIEYTPAGEIAWYWNSNDYFSDADLFSRKRGDSYDVRTHLNAFTTDGELVFAGFRDLSRIVVINKKSKKVIESYGGYGEFDEPHAGTGYFRRQHSAYQLSSGHIAVFNNDSIMDPSVVSSVVIFSRIQDNATSEVLLDFKMDFDSLTNGKSAKTGNVTEMTNGNLLVNLGEIPRAVEVTQTGEVVWSMFCDKFDDGVKQWKPFAQYRVHHASSLYPYEFTTLLVNNQLEKRNRKLIVRIYNVGTEADSFNVTCFKGKKVLYRSQSEVSSASFTDVSIKIKGKKEMGVRIQSIHSQEQFEIFVPGFR